MDALERTLRARRQLLNAAHFGVTMSVRSALDELVSARRAAQIDGDTAADAHWLRRARDGDNASGEGPDTDARRAAILSTVDPDGCTALIALCTSKRGGTEPGGWLSTLVLLLRVAGDDTAWVNAASDSGATALHRVAEGASTKTDKAFAATIALLAYGADPTAKFQGDTPEALCFSHDIRSLLRDAAALGDGTEAVRRLLRTSSCGDVLHAPGMKVVKELPRLHRLLLEPSLRVILAMWADERERVLTRRQERRGGDMLVSLRHLPRAVLPLVLMMCGGGRAGDMPLWGFSD